MKNTALLLVLLLGLIATACGKKEDDDKKKRRTAVPPNQNCLDYNSQDPRCYNNGGYGQGYGNYGYGYGQGYGQGYYGYGYGQYPRHGNQWNNPNLLNCYYNGQGCCDLSRGSFCPDGRTCRPTQYGSYIGYCS